MSDKTEVFNKGMLTDVSDMYPAEGTWFHMRNGVNNSSTGDLGVVGNEPANYLCCVFPYAVIGFGHAESGKWVVFCTDDTDSEIGMFDENTCTYTTTVNDPCLDFSTLHLITAFVKVNSDCTYQVYWADGLNPDRTMNMDKVPYKCVDTVVNPNDPDTRCVECINLLPLQLDCEKIRLAPLFSIPCLTVSKGNGAGSLKNGSYMATVAYTINGQRITDYLNPSNVQGLFEHNNTGGSISVALENLDTAHFSEYELVVIRINDNQTSARRMGLYSTHQDRVDIDNISETLAEVPLNFIPLRTPVFERSDRMQSTGGYLLRIGPRNRFDFNYQPLANRIQARWAAFAYPATYYENGGNNVGYLRDEVYPFFIRWVYNTGEKSSSYHIPGRRPLAAELQTLMNSDVIEPLPTPYWQVYNTGSAIPMTPPTVPDGGVFVQGGEMGYWQSTERYPADRQDIWNSSAHPWSDPGNFLSDLCGKNIRHHKIPDNAISPHINGDSSRIHILGVFFEGIRPPVDNSGNLIPGIVGYEILRGSREGNRSVIAKGLLNNMRRYDINLDPTQPTFNELGLYQNYPYNPLYVDPSMSETETPGGYSSIANVQGLSKYSKKHFTLHSPSTQFWKPTLTGRELKLYGEMHGDVTGRFEQVKGHPKHKLMTDIAFIVAALVGFGTASIAIKGKRSKRSVDVIFDSTGFIAPLIGGFDAAVLANIGIAPATIAANVAIETLAESSIVNLAASVLGGTNAYDAFLHKIVQAAQSAIPFSKSAGSESNIEQGEYANLPPLARVIGGISVFSNYWSLGTDSALKLIQAAVPFTQYAMRYVSHGLSSTFSRGNALPGNTRRRLSDAIYLDNSLENFGTANNYKVNNLFRGSAVAIETLVDFANDPLREDTTLQTIGSASGQTQLVRANGSFINNQGLPLGSQRPSFIKPSTPFKTTASSFYAGIKVDIENQYGQIDSVVQLPVGCLVGVSQQEIDQSFATGFGLARTPVFFGGDTYVTRYSEKNTFFYFSDWLLNQPDGTEYDYRLRYMVNYARYWADTQTFEASEFLSGFMGWLTSGGTIPTPSKKARLDGDNSLVGLIFSDPLNPVNIFRISQKYFYLFQSAVRDFFVESEVNTAHRDWGDLPSERHYDPYGLTDLDTLFNPLIIKDVNFFRYDRSLSVSKLFTAMFSWGSTQARDYDPFAAQTCYVHYPKRIIYSLPYNLESKKDYWRVWLANNYRDFASLPTAVKPVNKSGAMIFFQSDSPVQFQGTDQLDTELGTKITIGDGGLFSQPMQSVMNADLEYEYGSCQDPLSVINTPHGLFWVSQQQGKIFKMGGGADEISRKNMNWWFKNNLPYHLLQSFPTFSVTGNSVAGIGVQCVYDNQDGLFYICKRDFKLRGDITSTVEYLQDDLFKIDDIFTVKLGDGRYFEPASWTVSYDPKTEQWLSYHDWHPSLLMPSRNNFLSFNKSTLWRHNDRTDLYCNYYGQQYPWEVGVVVVTLPETDTLRSIEYQLDARTYRPTGEWFSMLEEMFDYAILWNKEQISGLLQMTTQLKNTPFTNFPVILSNGIRILQSKEEQLSRFNQFWDVTRDRGEFTAAQNPLILYNTDGYTFDVNPFAVDYQKPQFQRKKLRGNAFHLFLRKRSPGKIKMLLKLATVKTLISKR